jgi:hypothetical protein
VGEAFAVGEQFRDTANVPEHIANVLARTANVPEHIANVLARTANVLERIANVLEHTANVPARTAWGGEGFPSGNRFRTSQRRWPGTGGPLIQWIRSPIPDI